MKFEIMARGVVYGANNVHTKLLRVIGSSAGIQFGTVSFAKAACTELLVGRDEQWHHGLELLVYVQRLSEGVGKGSMHRAACQKGWANAACA